MPKFSVILPVRNGGNYIKECVQSILSQTFSDFELIILENYSTDDTLQIIEDFNDKRIKVIPASAPLNIEENWARIVDVPKAEFLTLIGHDDLLQPNFLDAINKLIEKYPDASLYHTHFDFIDSSGKITRPCKPMPEKLQQHELLQGFLNNTIDSMGTGYAMRSADYEKIGGIPAKYPGLLFADFDLWLKLAGINYEAIAPDNCFAFRVHHSATSLSGDAKLHDGLSIFTDCLATLKQENQQNALAIEKYGAEFLTRYAISYSHRILRTPKGKRGNVSVENFIRSVKQMAEKISLNESFQVEKNRNVRIAKTIDNSALLSMLFLTIRKKYGKAFIK